MAVINKKNSLMEFPLQIKRQYAGPIEANEIFYDLEEAKTYAKSDATAYVGQTIKVVDEKQKTVTTYTIQADGSITAGGNAQHTHAPSEIVETAEKRFVSDKEKARWNDTYTKSETDKKLTDAISGLTFKGTFENYAALPNVETAKDGWFAIVINEPTAEGKNVLVIFESRDKKWKPLNELLVPGIATEDLEGLMSKEMVKSLKQAGIDIAGLKDGSLLPKASATQIGAVKQGANITIAPDGTISTHAPYQHPESHAASMITEDASHRFVTDSEKAVYADKYTKVETETKISDANNKLETKITSAYEAADTLISNKVNAVESEYKAADVQIKKDYVAADTALETKLTKAFGDADTALKGQIETAYKAEIKTVSDKVDGIDAAYKAADVKINETISAMDTAYKGEDTKIRSEFAAADAQIKKDYAAADTALEGKVTEAYKAADTVIEGKVTALTEAHNNDKAALEGQIKAVEAKMVAASESQIDALFK